MKRITVRSRLGESEAVADSVVAAFDHYDEEAGRDVRQYVLLNESVKLMHEPWGWRDRWYVDLVRVRRMDDSVIEIADLYVDLIIEGNGPTYRIIDLGDLGEALASGKVRGEELREPLRQLQTFLDKHIHGFPDGVRDFPPACIRPFMPEA